MELTERTWDTVVRGDNVQPRDQALFHIIASDAARAAVEVVETVTEAAGTTANRLGHPLERINRDVRVVRQHATVAPHLIEDAGRALLNLEPETFILRSRRPGVPPRP